MTEPTQFTIGELSPQHLDRPEHFNDWYFTVHFVHEGKPCLAKFSITEGSLLGQMDNYTFCQDAVALEHEPDAKVLRLPDHDLNLTKPEKEMGFNVAENEVKIQMGELTAICRPDRQRIISTNEILSGDLTCTARGPILHWGHEAGKICQVTEVTRVSGSESLSDVKGEITFGGKRIEINGRGLFERVWFSALNFFQIRAMNWLYAHFDEMYLYICHCESVTGDSRPFHFETGEMQMIVNNEFMTAKSLEFMPESWVFFPQARRFIPLEQSITVKAVQGTLKLKMRLSTYPLLLQPPARLENLTVDNISGWSSLFYDAPVMLEGKFTYRDGRIVKLANGTGINEQIRISAL
jgi:hypothetical protein